MAPFLKVSCNICYSVPKHNSSVSNSTYVCFYMAQSMVLSPCGADGHKSAVHIVPDSSYWSRDLARSHWIILTQPLSLSQSLPGRCRERRKLSQSAVANITHRQKL